MAENDFATNGNDGQLMIPSTRRRFNAEWLFGNNNMHGYETETYTVRCIGKTQWLSHL